MFGVSSGEEIGHVAVCPVHPIKAYREVACLTSQLLLDIRESSTAGSRARLRNKCTPITSKIVLRLNSMRYEEQQDGFNLKLICSTMNRK